MKRCLLFLLLLSLPLLSFAKYCPTCLKTFQSQTVRGTAQLVYRWITKIRDPKQPIEYNALKKLFDKKVKVTVNGNLVARDLPSTYRYLIRLRQQRPLKASKLRLLVTDGPNAILDYQVISQRNGRRYRSLVITILHFKSHRVLTWTTVSHTTRIAS